MGIVVSIDQAVTALFRLFGLSRITRAMSAADGTTAPPLATAVVPASAPASVVTALVAPALVAPAVVAPAVAGFVMRDPAARYYLAARLAAVAKLNTPFGRKPRVEDRRSNGRPAIPVHRLGAKQTRLNGNNGPRVLAAGHRTTMRLGNVVPFPARSNRNLGAVEAPRRLAA